MLVQESPESASPSVTRAVAAALTGEDFVAFEAPAWQRTVLTGLDALAPGLVPKIVQWETKRRSLRIEAATRVDVEVLAAARVNDYLGWRDTSQAIVVGSSLGGAAAYIAAALGAPFLPEPFILSFQGGSSKGHLQPHLDQALKLGKIVELNNPNATLISHFDPVHDGWLTGFVNHLRLKLRELPASYRGFIQEKLSLGGTILHLDCTAEWLNFRLSDRHRYQVGGWGGISATEFMSGSRRIDDFLKSAGLQHRGGWHPPDAEPHWNRESEWASEPEFGDSLRRWATEKGYRYQAISLPGPNHYSALAFLAYQLLFQKMGIEPQGIFIGMFNQYDPRLAQERALLPLWLVFNTTDSEEFLKFMKNKFPELPIFFAALVTFSETPDMVPWSNWDGIFDGFQSYTIGARPERYPADTVALWRWQERLRRLTKPMHAERVSLAVAEIMEQVKAIRSWRDDIPKGPLAER